jgi:hypothetical protein
MKKSLAVMLAISMMVGLTAAQPAQDELPEPGALPGNAMYGIQQAQESVNLFMATTFGGDERAAEVRQNLAEKRLSEAKALAEENRTEDAEKALQKYQNQMENARKNVENAGNQEAAQALENASQKHIEVLEGVKEKVPEEAQKGIQNAIENSQNFRNGIERGIEDGKFGKPEDAGNQTGASDRIPDSVPGFGGQ